MLLKVTSGASLWMAGFNFQKKKEVDPLRLLLLCWIVGVDAEVVVAYDRFATTTFM